MGLLPVGTYALSDYSFGRARSSSLVVTDLGSYRQTFDTGSGLFQVWPVQSQGLFPFRIELAEMNLGGIYFTPAWGLPVYRPYDAPGVLSPTAGGQFTMYSGQAGGVYVDIVWRVKNPETLLVGGVPVPVQRMDVTMVFFGSGSGILYHRHWETGSPLDFRDDYSGEVTVLGQLNVVETSLAHGRLAKP